MESTIPWQSNMDQNGFSLQPSTEFANWRRATHIPWREASTKDRRKEKSAKLVNEETGQRHVKKWAEVLHHSNDHCSKPRSTWHCSGKQACRTLGDRLGTFENAKFCWQVRRKRRCIPFILVKWTMIAFTFYYNTFASKSQYLSSFLRVPKLWRSRRQHWHLQIAHLVLRSLMRIALDSEFTLSYVQAFSLKSSGD